MIRLLTSDDFDAFYAIRLEALRTNPEAFLTAAADFEARPRAAEEARFLTTVGSADQLIAGAFLDGVAKGMTGLRRYDDPSLRHMGQIWGVFVSPIARGRGFGRQMMALAIREAGRIGLTALRLSVRRGNEPAVHLYESLGFEHFTPAADDPIFATACATEHHMILELTANS